MPNQRKESVRISIDKLAFALIISDTADALVYDTPDMINGVTELTVSRNSSILTHRSSGGPEQIRQDGDTQIDMILDGVSEALKAKYISGYYNTENGMYREGWGGKPPELAVGFRGEKANGKFKYTWFYKGALAVADEKYQHKTNTVTPQGETYKFSAVEPQYVVDPNNNLKSSFQSDDPNAPIGLTDAALANLLTGWFSTPQYVPTAPGTPISDLAASTGTGASGSVALAFSAPAGAASVKVQVETPTGKWEDIATAAALSASATSATINGLTPSGIFNFRLAIVGGASNGISNESSATAKA